MKFLLLDVAAQDCDELSQGISHATEQGNGRRSEATLQTVTDNAVRVDFRDCEMKNNLTCGVLLSQRVVRESSSLLSDTAARVTGLSPRK